MSLHAFRRLSLSLIQKASVRYTSAFRYHMILREPEPDDITICEGGIPVKRPPPPTLTGVTESRDPDEWKFVLALLPSKIVPEPPKHLSYPTPSGWVPPKEHVDTPYRIRRTRFHNLPVYHNVLNGGSRPFTTVCKVEGDIWALDADIREFITEHTGKITYTRVDEVCHKSSMLSSMEKLMYKLESISNASRVLASHKIPFAARLMDILDSSLPMRLD